MKKKEIYSFKLIPENELFYSDDSNYGVYKFSTIDDIPYLEDNSYILFDKKSDNKIGTIVGNMQQLIIGEEYEVETTVEFNKKYNSWQYKPIRIVTKKPTNKDEQLRFLKSIITEKQSETLVEAYPNIVDDIINNKEIDLNKTKGIKEYTFSKIKKKVLDNYVIADVLAMLQPLGISYKMILKLVENESNPTLLKIKLHDNPYMLTKIHGLGFKRVDGLALKINPDIRISEKRTYAFLVYYFNEIGSNEGHTWVYIDKLKKIVKENVPECIEIFDEIIIKEKDNPVVLYVSDDRISLKRYYNIEKQIFKKINELQNSYSEYNINPKQAIINTQNRMGFELTDEQKEAIYSLVDNNVIVITANAGGGKTTVINGVIDMFKPKYTVAMCSLSAKAAQRMVEVTGSEAQTIHRLLGYKGFGFTFNEINPLPYDVIVLDEASMVNAELFLDLIKAIKNGSKLVLVFDDAQLPPIGVGNIASDLLKSTNIKINKFTKVHRQASKSGILVDANKVRQGISPVETPKSKIVHGELKDMYYLFRNDREMINDLAIKAYLEAIDKVGIDNVTIITPRKKDCVNSTREINNKIQDLLIGNDVPFVNKGKYKIKLGAKVIQRVNDYEKDVVNGEIGYIDKIYKDKEVDEIFFNIKFNENKTITYHKDEVVSIDLAYALTVHSSQGSEWDVVIVVIDNSHYILLDNCLLYTAITRASKKCMLIAEPSAFQKCIRTNKGKERQTFLKEMLQNNSKQ